MLKLKLTTLDGLSADVAKEYKKEGDEYVLDTDVKFEDVTGLKNALAQEKQHRKQATEKVTTLEQEKATLEARAGSAGDLEKSWQKKLTDKEAEFKTQLTNRDAQLRAVLVDNTALQLAQEISTSPDLILPHIKARLTMEEVDGKMLTRVLDGEGKMSAASVGELKNEIVADKRFASIITASKASGGGAQGAKSGSSAGGKKYADMSEAERSTLYRENKPEFDRLRAEHKATPAA